MYELKSEVVYFYFKGGVNFSLTPNFFFFFF